MTQKSMHEVIELTVELAAPRASGEGLALNCHIDSDFKKISNFDDWCVTQLVSNLLNNALRYTDEGAVEVNARCTSQSDDPNIYHYDVSIIDTGPGIPSEVRRVMFALPEQRESIDAKPDIGVGLVIAKQLSDIIGATLMIEPGMTGGTIATIRGTIDISETPTTENSTLTQALRNTQAIIVDTDMAARRLLEANLRSWDIDVRSVLDVDSAIERARTAANAGLPISMVFISHENDERDVRRLVQTLDDAPIHADAMLVVLGSDAMLVVLGSDVMSTVRRVPTAGTTSITLMKPVRPSELYNCISQHPHIISSLRGSEKTDTSVTASDDQRRVLLVEDNIVNQCVAAEILKRIGTQVTIANNGIEALEQLRRAEFDFVFMDCQMPEMDGFEATKRIRSDLGLKKLPVVALTANALSGDRQTCIDAGMSDYLTKPFTREQLSTMLDKWVSATPENDCDKSANPVIDDDSLIDNDALDQIRQLDTDGETTIFDEIINEYLASSRNLSKQIEDAVLKTDPDGVSRVAHALKSSSAAVGLAQFARHCADLERLGHQGDTDGIETLWGHAQPILQRSVQLLSSLQNRVA
ncbi:MAG: response regulator [Pseudomonadota bacterium]